MPPHEVATPPLTGRIAERALHQLILDERIGDEVLPYVLPDGHPHAWEGSLWDYKLRIDFSEQEGIAQLIKDVVAFHNSFGGYMIIGIDHHSENPTVGWERDEFNVEKLTEQLVRYTRVPIKCRFRRVYSKPEDSANQVVVGLLLVPMRRADAPIVQMTRGSPERLGSSPLFKKGDIFARIGDRCIPIQGDVQGLQFVCSRRHFGLDMELGGQVENNLPPKDPNLVRFIGRTEYLLQLWSWLTDRHTPVKVVTALGGTGKTAVVFEFCLRLISDPPAWLAKVVWLTAKKQAFSAIQGQYVSVTRTDFESPDGFLAILAQELGATDEEITEADDRESRLDLVLKGLRMFPALVVLDDIDSLVLEEQADLFSTVQTVAGRSFDQGNRFILTSRLELGAGESQLIRLAGFDEDEFAEYAKMTAGLRQIKLTDGVIHRLYKASLGSPVFCASILRLVSLGTDINTAIKHWKGSEGEVVRKFAFERELEQLTDSQARTLFALSALGETTQLELRQVLNTDDHRMTLDLARLREFHLFASRGDPGTGTKLEVPEPIRLMSDILRRRLTDPARIERECARLRSQVPKVQDKVAIAIAGILSLWRADDYEAALFSAQQARKTNPKSGDINCVLGQCYLKIRPAKPDEAEKAFRQAFTLGCGRPELISNWLDAKRLMRDWPGITELAHKAPPRGDSQQISSDCDSGND